MISHLFEISYEVCNKVGGIYTVISSKAPSLTKYVKNHICIGPYFGEKPEFTPLPAPKKFQEVFDQVPFACHYGEWNIPSKPKVILIEFQSMFSELNEYKRIFYEQFQVDSLTGGYDYEEPFAFSLAAGKVIELFAQKNKSVVQTHEWMTGFTNLYLKSKNANVKTVFTTHATMLGRAMCGNGMDVYNDEVDPYQKAAEIGVLAKHTAERACAHHSDVFTTVSDVTAKETEKLLGKKPDIITYNGFDIEDIPPLNQLFSQIDESRQRLLEFIEYYFFPSQQFDLQNTKILFTSGRHEVRNKGIDVAIRALGELNQQLTEDDPTVVFFIWVPYEVFGVKKEIIEQKLRYRHLKRLIQYESDEIEAYMQRAVFENISSIKLSEGFTQETKKTLRYLKKDQNPPLCPFEIRDNNEIINLLIQNNLTNKPEDKVKVVYYPVYLEGNDQLLDMDYLETISGCDLGVFASYYEPWGYTPLEAVSVSVPAVTTNLAGFGRYMQPTLSDDITEGVYVLEENEQLQQNFVNFLQSFISLEPKQAMKAKIHAQILSEQADWKDMITNYIRGYEQ